jgi:hypothetical protein
MAEPEREDGDVDACMQQAHCGGVPEGVWGDLLRGQGRAVPGRDPVVFREAGLDGVRGQRPALAGAEQRGVRVAPAFGQPVAQCRDGGRLKGRVAFFPALAEATDIRFAVEVDVAAGQLGGPEPVR